MDQKIVIIKYKFKRQCIISVEEYSYCTFDEIVTVYFRIYENHFLISKKAI